MKQLLFPLLYTLLLPSLVLQSGCNPDDYGPFEDNPTSTPDSGFVFFGIYEPGEVDNINILDIVRYPCGRDSVKVYDEDGEIPELFEFESGGNIAFRATQDDQIHQRAFSQEVSRRFQLYINYREVHWIELRYKVREVKCNYDVFEYIEVYFDDALYQRIEDFIEIPRIVIEQNSLDFNPCP